MKGNVIRTTDSKGNAIAFHDQIMASGGMKDVHKGADGDYVVAFFRNPLDRQGRERLDMITGPYRDRIFGDDTGAYWERMFCWPTATVEHEGRVGVVVPFYQPHFFFEHGSFNGDMLKIKGKDKEGKWFASPNNQFKYLDEKERGSWLSYLQVSLKLARALRRIHAAGLAHSDLSYRNVLLAPTHGEVCIIDIDGLVVPGKYPPDVVGTPDFIAPEVVATSHLSRDDPARHLPSINTDRHALAVMVYTLLLLRHPLRGKKVHAQEAVDDERLSMGEKALFVEHPSDDSNRIDPSAAKPSELPWKDTGQLPYTITGPYLSELFERAFVAGLHDPGKRPTADEWENALIRTVDLIQPCQNPECAQKWFVFDNTTAPCCPFCKTPYRGQLPVINFYSRRGESYRPDNHRLMVYSNQSLFKWHINRMVVPNERLAVGDRGRVGYFVSHQGRWFLVNEGIKELKNAKTGDSLPIGSQIELENDMQLLAGTQQGDRLLYLQIVNG